MSPRHVLSVGRNTNTLVFHDLPRGFPIDNLLAHCDPVKIPVFFHDMYSSPVLGLRGDAPSRSVESLCPASIRVPIGCIGIEVMCIDANVEEESYVHEKARKSHSVSSPFSKGVSLCAGSYSFH